MENLKYRMYGLVNYQFTNSIHSGIQFGHAVVEYANQFFNDDAYQQWALNDKTFIVLNGGTTNNNPLKPGSLNIHLQTLKDLGIKIGEFSESDLGDQLTAFVFLVDERVWDKKKYQQFEDLCKESEDAFQALEKYKKQFKCCEEEFTKIEFLRNYLSKLKLA